MHIVQVMHRYFMYETYIENANKLINTRVLVSANIFDKIGPAVLENGYLYNNNRQSNFRSHITFEIKRINYVLYMYIFLCAYILHNEHNTRRAQSVSITNKNPLTGVTTYHSGSQYNTVGLLLEWGKGLVSIRFGKFPKNIRCNDDG